MIKVTPTTGSLGAEITGIDLRKTLSESEFEALQDALVKHLVIFFRDQDIEPQHHVALGKWFGTPHAHPAYPNPDGFPEIVKLINSKENPSKIEEWHTDMTFMKCPPMGSILHAKKIPAIGGDTMFASMELAYDELSTSWQRMLDELTAIHDFTFGFQESLAEPGGRERLKDAIEKNPPIAHPVIRAHPISGRKSIFVNKLFTRNIVGMSKPESEAILQMLYQHVIKPEYCCRFRWEENSIAFWDNRATQHKPVNDYFPAYREMWRVTILGDQPFGPK
jgi:taurine dioxygenase